jgi:CRP-like cAMP-binding protein
LELLDMLANRLRESTRRRFESGVYDVTTRTARWLLDAAAHGEPIAMTSGYLIRLTQKELADAVGASRVAVANALRAFRDVDAVSTDRAGVRVLRPERLRPFASRSGVEQVSGEAGRCGESDPGQQRRRG